MSFLRLFEIDFTSILAPNVRSESHFPEILITEQMSAGMFNEIPLKFDRLRFVIACTSLLVPD